MCAAKRYCPSSLHTTDKQLGPYTMNLMTSINYRWESVGLAQHVCVGMSLEKLLVSLAVFCLQMTFLLLKTFNILQTGTGSAFVRSLKDDNT